MDGKGNILYKPLDIHRKMQLKVVLFIVSFPLILPRCCYLLRYRDHPWNHLMTRQYSIKFHIYTVRKDETHQYSDFWKYIYTLICLYYDKAFGLDWYWSMIVVKYSITLHVIHFHESYKIDINVTEMPKRWL